MWIVAVFHGFLFIVSFFCFLYQNFSRNAEHLRFQVNAFCGYVHKIILFFLCVCWCCAMASKIVARRTILDPKREWIFVGKLYANHSQISKCLAFLAILIVYALHCMALYLCASFLLYDFCQSLFPYMITLRFYMWIFLVAYRMLLIILTVKQAR